MIDSREFGLIVYQGHPFYFRKSWILKESSYFNNAILQPNEAVNTPSKNQNDILEELNVAKGTNNIEIQLQIPMDEDDRINQIFRTLLFILKNITSKISYKSLGFIAKNVTYIGFNEYSFLSTPKELISEANFDREGQKVLNVSFRLEMLNYGSSAPKTQIPVRAIKGEILK